MPGGGEISNEDVDKMKAALGIEKGTDLDKIIDGEYDIQGGVVGHLEDMIEEYETSKSDIEDALIDLVFTEEHQQSVEELLDEIEANFQDIINDIQEGATENFSRYDESCL